jgi:hypothetical protein
MFNWRLWAWHFSLARLWSALQVTFGDSPFSEKAAAARDEILIRKICARTARGNISLQNGMFVTREQIAAKRDKVFRCRFSVK